MTRTIFRKSLAVIFVFTFLFVAGCCTTSANHQQYATKVTNKHMRLAANASRNVDLTGAITLA